MHFLQVMTIVYLSTGFGVCLGLFCDNYEESSRTRWPQWAFYFIFSMCLWPLLCFVGLTESK
jgi:hypothetical protein